MLKKTAASVPPNIASIVISSCAEYSSAESEEPKGEIMCTSPMLKDTTYLRRGHELNCLSRNTQYVACSARGLSSSAEVKQPHIRKSRKPYRPVEVKNLLKHLIRSEAADGACLDVHAKCKLEVQDPKHRYGKYLRAYHKEWRRIGEPMHDFFAWLDGATVDLQHVPFSAMNAEIVHYIEDEAARSQYLLEFRNGKLCRDGSNEGVTTGEVGWIFVLADNKLYASRKVTDRLPRFHHTSFLGGGRVQMAGILTASNGEITAIYPHSGHYRPRETNLLLLLLCMIENDCDLSKAEVDMQRTMRVNREALSCTNVEGFDTPESKCTSKRPKMDTALMWNGMDALDFLLSLRSWESSGTAVEIRSRKSGVEIGS